MAVATAEAALLSNRGNELLAQGALAEAAALHARAVALEPENPDLLCNLAATLVQQGRAAAAAACLERAIAADPQHFAALNNLGSALIALGRASEAAVVLRRAAELRPEDASLRRHLGEALRRAGALAEAEAAYRAALARDPRDSAALNELAVVLRSRDRPEEAAQCCEAALAIRPDMPEALSNLGNALCAMGEVVPGVAAYERALQCDPEHSAAHMNLGIALLTLGEFPAGSAHYEWRWRERPSAVPRVPAPRWDGAPLPGGTLLLCAEQGLGDAIQFVRYAALIRPMAGRLLLRCPTPLVPLFAGLPDLDEVLPDDRAPPPCDAYLSLLSSMQRLGTTLATIPATVPYLAADPERVARLAPLLGDGVRVGLVWSGNRQNPQDRNRSIALAALEPLLTVPGVRFFSLQVGPRGAEAKAPGFAEKIVDLAPALADFADTAAAASRMDLLITVDTAAAHLAGALAKPVWVLLPFAADWRWLIGRADSPWYPTMRLFRQERRGDWAPVIGEVTAALIRLILDGTLSPRPSLLNDCGILLRRIGRFDDAIRCFERLIALRPDLAIAHNNRGLLLQDKERPAEAVAAHRRCVALDPDFADGHNNLAVALDKSGDPAAALPHYRRALELDPDHAEALTNLGNRLHNDGEIAEAIALQRRAVALRPDKPDGFNNLGFALKTAGAFAEAIQCFRRAIALRPDFVAAHVNLALALLTSGDLRDGAAEYEWRWRGYHGAELPKLGIPLWQGEDLTGKSLLLWAEQGFGDTIQFVRYGALLRGRASRVVLACQAPLTALMATAPGIDQVVSWDAPPPPADAFVPLLGLMHRFGTTLATIPAPPAYLFPDPQRVATYSPALPPGRLRVGLAWAGNSKHGNDRWRSVPPALLAPLLAVPGVRFFSLQHGARAAEIPPGVDDLSPLLLDFAETAALMSGLDLVITVDTAVAHLAGALGRPVWVLVPASSDWRWLAGRADSPWYPSMRLFRQQRFGEWAPVVAAAAGALAQAAQKYLSHK
jgi:tetratricopeptide (TPR) repeat protein